VVILIGVKELHRGRIWHGQLPSQYRFAFPIDVIIFLIVPLANLGFARDDIRVMTDENPWDLPTKENIVSRLCEMSLLSLLDFVQLGGMRALVYDAQPEDTFFFYCR
jgi:hypothetical protein